MLPQKLLIPVIICLAFMGTYMMNYSAFDFFLLVLFGLLGAFLLFAAFRPAYQPVALIAGFVSVVSFLWIAHSTGGYNVQVGRVFAADVVALACLVIAAAAYAYAKISS
jgi:TctA family transporter